MKTITGHVQDWQQGLRVKNFTPESIRTYGVRIKPFVAFCAMHNLADLALVDRDFIRRYWTYLKTSPKQYSLCSLGVLCRALKSLFKHLQEQGHIQSNPTDILSHPDRRHDRLPKQAPSHAQVMQVMAVPDTHTLPGLRDRAVMELLYSTGLRVGECVALSVFDVDLQGGIIRVKQGKGRKDRDVPLGIEATRWLRRYLEEVRPKYAARNPEPTDKLWINRRGHTPETGQVQSMIRKYRKGLPGGPSITPHAFRRALATGMISHGADLGSVKGILGHADIYTTARYAQVLAQEMVQTHDQTHPRQKSTETQEKAMPQMRLNKDHRACLHLRLNKDPHACIC